MIATDPMRSIEFASPIGMRVLGIGKITLVLLSISCTTVLPGCSEWPPYSTDLPIYVNNRKDHLDELISHFNSSGFGRISCQLCLSDSAVSEWKIETLKFDGEIWQPVANDHSNEYAQMLSDAGVSAISRRSSGSVELEIATQGLHGDRMYTIQLFHHPEQDTFGYKECIAEFEENECGACKLSIDDSYWIRYQWYPTEIDPSLSEAGASGEISWEEWQAKEDVLMDACWESGLLRQGYERDKN